MSSSPTGTPPGRMLRNGTVRTGPIRPTSTTGPSEPVSEADEITLVVQINGKVRDRITVPADISEEDAKAQALASEGAKKFIDGNQPKKIFYVADRGMVNIVI